VTTLALILAGGTSFSAAVGTFTVTNGAMGLSFSACAVLLAWHRSRNPIGWLFLAAGVLEATSTCAIQWFWLGVRNGWPAGALRLLGTVFVYSWPWAVGLLLPATLLLC
jgi:two-component system, NarL family, sensor kinase